MGVTQEMNDRVCGRREEVLDFRKAFVEDVAAILGTTSTETLRDTCDELIADWQGCPVQDNWGDVMQEIKDAFQITDDAAALKIAVKLNNYYIETDNDLFLQNLADDFSFWDQVRLMVFAHLEHCLAQMNHKGKRDSLRAAASDWANVSNKDVNTLLCAALSILPHKIKNATQSAIKQWFENGWNAAPNTVKVSREILFRIAFALRLNAEEVTQMLALGLKRDLFHPKNYSDMIHKYCFTYGLSYETCAAMCNTCAGYILDKGKQAFSFYPIGETVQEQRGTLEMGSSIDEMIASITDPDAFVLELASVLSMNIESFAEHLTADYRGPKQDEAEKDLRKAEAYEKQAKKLAKALEKLKKDKPDSETEIHDLEEQHRAMQELASECARLRGQLEEEAEDWALHNRLEHLAKVRTVLKPEVYAILETEIAKQKPSYETIKNALKKVYVNANSVCRREFVQNCLRQYGKLLRSRVDPSHLSIFLQNMLMEGNASDAQLVAAMLNDDTSHYLGEIDAGKQLLTADYLKGICSGTEPVRRTDIFRLALLQEFFSAESKKTVRTLDNFKTTVNMMLSKCLYPCFYLRSADDRFFAICYASDHPLYAYHELMYKAVQLKALIPDTHFALSEFELTDAQWAAIHAVAADTIPAGEEATYRDWFERILCLGTNGLPWSKFERVQKEDSYTEGSCKDVHLIKNWFKQLYKRHRDELVACLQDMRMLLHMKDSAEVVELLARNLKMEEEA